MSSFTQSAAAKAIEKLSNLTGAIKKSTPVIALKERLFAPEPITDQLIAAPAEMLPETAEDIGVEPAFDAGGDVCCFYRRMPEQKRLFKENRGTTLKALKIGGGAVVGLTIAGLARREAYHRGWTDKAVQTLNRAMIPKLVTMQYGSPAGLAVKLAMNGKVSKVEWVDGSDPGGILSPVAEASILMVTLNGKKKQ